MKNTNDKSTVDKVEEYAALSEEEKLANLRNQFRTLLNQYDSEQFRFVVEMLYHSKELDERNYDEEVWQAAIAATNILYEAGADLSTVYAWGLRFPSSVNSREVRDDFWKREIHSQAVKAGYED